MPNITNTNLTKTSLWYAEELGLHVFPCWPESKKPATTNGFKNATKDAGTIKTWWEKVPQYNVAVWTSAESGIFALDIDRKKDVNGFKALEALEKKYGKLPDTWTQRTGGGGIQLFFKHPGKFVPKTEGAIAKGIDVRGDDGYSMLPPSVHPDTGRTYKWEKSPLEYPLKEAPDWLLELNEKGKEKKKKKGGQRKVVPYGERDDAFAREAGKLRAWGYEKEQIAYNLQYFYDNKCEHMAGDNPAEVKKRIEKLSERACQNWEPNAKEYGLTDMGNAERFGDMFAEVARYCTPWKKWVIWNKQYWTKDSALKVQELAKTCVRKIKEEAFKIEDTEKQQQMMKWYWKSQSSERLGAMIKQARSLLAIAPEDFDKDPWLFNVKNGTINLKTGELQKHDRGDLITKIAPVAYNKTAEYPTFKRFLHTIMMGNKELIEFVWKFLGYCLTGDIRERVFVVFHGVGQNGKSTLLECMQEMMGGYALATPAETLLAKEKGAIPNDIARLNGARFVCASENEEDKRLGAAVVKKLTGKDTIPARFLHGEYFDFKPTFKLCLGTNHLPRVSADDQAAWDRIRLVPFKMRVKNAKNPEGTTPEDKSLDKKLSRELSGILSWCVEGCLLWQQEGLGTPPLVEEATDSYRENEDLIAAFLDDLCLIGGEEETKTGDVYDAYKAWCNKNSYRPCGSQKFKRRLEKKDIVYKKKTEGRFWVGLALTKEASDLVGNGF